AANPQDLRLPSDCADAGLHVIYLAFDLGAVWIHDDRDPRRGRDQFAQQSETFCLDRGDEYVQPGRVAARPGEADDETQLDRIDPGDEDERNGLGGCLDCESGNGAAKSGNHRDLARYQIGNQCREPLISIFRPAILDGDVLILDISSLRQTLPKPG